MEATKQILVEAPGGIRTYMSLTDEELNQVGQILKDNPQLTIWEATELLPAQDSQDH